MTRRFEASPERVFDAWLNPATVRRWLFASPNDEAYTAEIDPRVGGRYTITARRIGTHANAVPRWQGSFILPGLLMVYNIRRHRRRNYHWPGDRL